MFWLLLVVSLSNGHSTFAPFTYQDATACNQAANVVNAHSKTTLAFCLPG